MTRKRSSGIEPAPFSAGGSCWTKRSRRAARILIWRSDSSPETYSTEYRRAISRATWSKQGGFPDTRISTDQHHRARDYSPAEDTGEFTNRKRQALVFIAADLCQAARGRVSAKSRWMVYRGGSRLSDQFFDHAVPGTAARAASHLAGAECARTAGIHIGCGSSPWAVL